MSARDIETIELLKDDTALGLILTGGIVRGATLGVEGITSSKTTPALYDAKGHLKLCLVIKQRAVVPTGQLHDIAAQLVSVSQVVEGWFYAYFSSSDEILAGLDRMYDLMEGHTFADAWPTVLAHELPIAPEPEMVGVVFARQDWLVNSLRRRKGA